MPFGPFSPRPPLNIGPFDSLSKPTVIQSPAVSPQQAAQTPSQPILFRLSALWGPWPTLTIQSPVVPAQQPVFATAKPIILKPLSLRWMMGGPFNAPQHYQPDAVNFVRLTQGYVETISSGDPAEQFVRLSQGYVETISSGDPAEQFVRLSQGYVEVICTFGTPPLKQNNGNGKGNQPGQVKKATLEVSARQTRRLRQSKQQLRNFPELHVTAWIPQPWMIPPRDPVRTVVRPHVVFK